MDIKEVIYCHRALRHFSGVSKLQYFLRFLLLTLPFIAAVVFFSSQLTLVLSTFARYILSLMTGIVPDLVTVPFSMFGDITLLSFMGRFPSPLFSGVVFGVLALTIVILVRSEKIPQSVAIYLSFICVITMASCLFFLIIPDKFPYSIARFSDLYIKTEIGIWCVIPVVMAVALLPLTSSLAEQAGIISATLMYSILFGCLRYALFLYLLERYSYLFMVTMFIAFDPPLDTIYIVGIYSWYASVYSKRVKNDTRIWQCG